MDLTKNLKLLIFDFDGTIHNLDMDWEQAREAIGSDEQETLGDAIDRQKNTGGRDALEALTQMEHESLKDENLNEEVAETLKQLGQRYKIAILSRNSAKVIKNFTERAGVAIDYIVGRDEVEKLKPHPSGLTLILNHFGSKPEQAILIGDTWHDQEAADAAGLGCIIIGNNYSHDQPPKYRIAGFTELNKLLIA